tara:strand:+ start:189 stop:425 length:237 start_codon:yes stop_codon:yes gene_type:complete
MNNADMPANVVTEDHWDRSLAAPATGLTKREHFAGLAMQGLLAGGYCMDEPQNRLSDVPSEAVALADALLAELSKSGE